MNPEKNPLILAVDRNQRNLELLMQFLTQEGYRILAATSPEELDRLLAGSQEIGLALVDVTGFDPSIWQRCQMLHQQGIPFLIVSSRRAGTTIQYQGIAYGARGVLLKPMTIKELLAILRSVLQSPL